MNNFETLRGFRGDVWASAEEHNADADVAMAEYDAALAALMDAFNDQAAELERTRELEVQANGRYLEAEATIEELRTEMKRRMAASAERTQMDGATIERLRAALERLYDGIHRYDPRFDQSPEMEQARAALHEGSPE